MHGSGALFRWLLDNDLVDEMTLFTFPVVVGQGTRLFPDTGREWALELVESRATPSGVTIQVYRPNGRPQYPTSGPTEAPDAGADDQIGGVVRRGRSPTTRSRGTAEDRAFIGRRSRLREGARSAFSHRQRSYRHDQRCRDRLDVGGQGSLTSAGSRGVPARLVRWCGTPTQVNSSAARGSPRSAGISESRNVIPDAPMPSA